MALNVTKPINKVVFGGETLIDLSVTTLAGQEQSGSYKSSQLVEGVTALDKFGNLVTGTNNNNVYTNATNTTALATEIISGKTAAVNGSIITGTMPSIGAQNSAISTKAGSVTISQGYHDGSGKVTISTTEQAKIIAGNIKEGVTILGVTGTCSPASGVKATTKSVTPSMSEQTVLPGTGYDYLSQVTVAAIPYSCTGSAATGYTVTIG